MDQTKHFHEILNYLNHPAFIVLDGKIAAANQFAEQYGVEPGISVLPMVADHKQEYEKMPEGQLCLKLNLSDTTLDATIVRKDTYDIFHLDQMLIEPLLNSLLGAASCLRKPLSDAMTCADKLEGDVAAALRHNLLKLHRSIGNMADASQIHSKRIASTSLTNVHSAFIELMDEVSKRLTAAGYDFQYTCTGCDVDAIIDWEKLQRALLNMIGNAARHGISSGKIIVKLDSNSRYVRYTVINKYTQSLLTLEDIPLSSFQRGPDELDTGIGFGLGMTLIRGAASAHNGTLLISTPKENEVQMTITIPVRKEKNPPVHSPVAFNLNYNGGYDIILTELSDILTTESYI